MPSVEVEDEIGPSAHLRAHDLRSNDSSTVFAVKDRRSSAHPTNAFGSNDSGSGYIIDVHVP